MNDRLKLESAVNFGLPVDFAGKVVGIESSNTDRIMKDLVSRRELERAALTRKPIEQRFQYESEIGDAAVEAELQALMAVSHARDEGLIKKRNILKMDRKINESIRKYLDTSGISYKCTLPEQVAQGNRWTLPMPF